MPMFRAWRCPHDIARADGAHRFAFNLHPRPTGGDDEKLPEGMHMPLGARARLKDTLEPPSRAPPVPLNDWVTETEPVKLLDGVGVPVVAARLAVAVAVGAVAAICPSVLVIAVIALVALDQPA